MRYSLWLSPLAVLCVLAIQNPEHFEDGSDLVNFVSRPDIKAPRMLVQKHKPDGIAPGYWFLTPYAYFYTQHKAWHREYIGCQTGATIYDDNGVGHSPVHLHIAIVC
jgi:hypothetical protein